MTGDGFFLLGLGAQKGGTTWMHRYLSAQPGAEFGALKEYHVWDVLSLDHFAYFSPFSTRARTRLLAKRLLGRNTRGERLRQRFCRDSESYFDYFAGLLQDGAAGLTGDITPSYSALDAAALGQIRAGFERRGVPVRVAFLMRDPVRRCYSAVRMYKRDRLSREGVDIRLDDDDALRRYVRTADAHFRTDYHRTLAAIDAVFAPEEVFFGFFETLFTEDEVRRLSAFVGVEPDPAFVSRRINASSSRRRLTPETIAAARAEFDETYSACAERFPVTRDVWLTSSATTLG